jgi:hypothetical protein
MLKFVIIMVTEKPKAVTFRHLRSLSQSTTGLSPAVSIVQSLETPHFKTKACWTMSKRESPLVSKHQLRHTPSSVFETRRPHARAKTKSLVVWLSRLSKRYRNIALQVTFMQTDTAKLWTQDRLRNGGMGGNFSIVSPGTWTTRTYLKWKRDRNRCRKNNGNHYGSWHEGRTIFQLRSVAVGSKGVMI